MTTKALMEHFSEREQKLANQLFIKKKDIQLLISNGAESCAILDDTLLDQYNLIIGFISKDGAVCNGTYANQHFSVPLSEESQLMRVWLDCRENKDIKYHINHNGSYRELSKDIDEKNEEILIVFLENPEFVQLCLYDGQLPYNKDCQIFITNEQAKTKIKTVAYSLLFKYFPGLVKELSVLEGDGYGKE